jgi:hypothetical protein
MHVMSLCTLLSVPHTDTLDEALAATVLAHMSAGGSSTHSSPTPSMNTTQPPTNPPQPPIIAQPMQHKQHGKHPAGPSSPSPLLYSFLQWSPTDLIAQLPPLLSPSLAAQLAEIAVQHHCDAAKAPSTVPKEMVVQLNEEVVGEQRHHQQQH